MDSTGYTTLTRQTGLMREMQAIANNIANTATTGFRQEGLIFSEYVVGDKAGPSLSMASANVRNTSFAQGALTLTGGTLDMAIEGDGFFLIDTPDGERLTRAGSFASSAEGELVTMDGHRVLDVGGAPLFIPPDIVKLGVASDGTMSAEGRLIGRIAVVRPTEMNALSREGGVLFRSDAPLEPAAGSNVLQGHVENSNVNTMLQFARMVEVQRTYEMGQSFLDTENERIRDAIRSFAQQ